MKILKNKFFIVGNIILLLVAIPLTLFFVKKQQDLRTKATAASKLYFAPATFNTSTQCSSFDVDVMIDPSTNLVSIVDFYLTFDPTKVDISKITPSDNFKVIVRDATIISGSANMSVSTGADVTKNVSTITKVATITFVPKGAGNFLARFDTSKTRVFSLGPADAPSENVLSTTGDANITVGTSACLSGPSGTPPGVSSTPGLTASPSTTPGLGGSNTIPTCSSLTANPSSGTAPFAVLFTGVGTDLDPTGLITKATFTFGDGQIQDVTTGLNVKNANTQVNHTYTTAGSFSARLVFTDNAGGLSSACTQSVSILAASGSATITPIISPTSTPTVPPTATPTLVEKPTVAPSPTIVPPGGFVETMGTLSLIIITLVGGFVLLAL